MRSLLLLVALVACKGADDTDPDETIDTDPAEDTDPGLPDTDTDPGDTDDTDPGDTDDTDEPCTTEFWKDADGDGFGRATGSVVDCELPDGFSTISGDCDDDDDSAYPGAVETCDFADDDCDGTRDNDPIDGTTYYTDLDDDDHGDPTKPVVACALPEDGARDGDDCDETDPDVHPGARDVCLDGLDADCDGADDACFPTGDYDVSVAAATWTGGTDENFGDILANGGDIDGDGIEDLLVGANGRSSSSSASRNGALWFVYGDASATGALASTDHARKDSASRCLEDVDGVGDVDGDGLGDFAVGATCWGWDGGVLLTYGSATRITGYYSSLVNDAAWQGSGSYTYLGSAVAGGDVDGDGFSDVLFADYTSVYVAYGAATRFSTTAGTAGLFQLEGGPYAMPGGSGDGISAGDVDGDGIDDLLAYDYWNRSASGQIPGEVHLLYGDSAGWTGTVAMVDADAHFVGPTGHGYVGLGMANTAGDLDGDGYDEVIAASRVYDSLQGAVWVWSGSAARYADDIESTEARFMVTGTGASVQFATDVVVVPDLDGLEGGELLIGSDGYGGHLFRGEAGLSGTYTSADANATFAGAALADGMGESVIAGDFDGDGQIDIAVGAGEYSVDVGMLYLYAGSGF